MADGTRLNSNSSSGDLIATDELSSGGFSGQKAQVVKLLIGADAAGELVSNSTPLPVSDAGSTLSVDDGSSSLTIDNATLAVTGGGAESTALRVTLASDSTGLVSVDDNGSTLSVDDGGGSLTIDGTVAVSSLPASTNTIEVVGDATHDAAVAGNPVLTGGYASAAAPSDVSGDGDVVRAWHLRNGAQATVITAAGALVGGDATNGLDVDVTRIIPGTSATHLGKAVDSAAGSSDTGVAMLAVRDDTLATLTPVDGDYVPLRTSSTGALHISVTEGGIAGRAEDSAHSTGHDGIVVLAVRRDTASSGVDTDGDYATLSTDSTGNLRTAAVGAAAQDAAISGNPLPIGARASTATPTAMSADGDVVYPWATRSGALVTAGTTVDDAAFTAATDRVHPVGFFADETSTDSVDEGDIGAARMSLDRKQYVIAHSETSTIYQNGTARTPSFAVIDAASSGDNTLLAAQGAGNKIRVHQLFLVSAGTVTVRFESGAGGTALTGQMNLVANTGFVLPYSQIGWFETAANTLLNLELSGAVSVDGNFAYTVVT